MSCSFLCANYCGVRGFGRLESDSGSRVRTQSAAFPHHRELAHAVMNHPFTRDGAAGVPVATAEHRMLYLGGYKALCPTLGFPSAGTPSSLSQVFHPRARCLLTTSHLYHPFHHACKNRHFLPCPCRLYQRHSSSDPGRYVPLASDHFPSLTSVTAPVPTDMRSVTPLGGHVSTSTKGRREGTSASRPLPIIFPAHANYSYQPGGPPDSFQPQRRLRVHWPRP